jgi:thiol-disulfide isomerase/thioredoxin
MSLYVDDETAGAAPSSSTGAAAGSSFQRRMRDRYLQTQQPRRQQQQQQQPQQQQQQLPDNVQHVESLSDYRAAIAKAGDRTVVVRFYAKWCKVCRALAPAFYRLARMNPAVAFLDVPVLDSNAPLHQGLGVPSVPYAYIYYKGVLVEETKVTRQRFPAFVSKVKMYSRGTCECVGEECDVSAEGGEEGGQL